MKRLIRLALVLSVLYGTGIHWAVLQTYAWTTMALSGQISPCRVCKVVEKGSTAKPLPLLVRASSPLDLALPGVPRLIAVLSGQIRYVEPCKSARSQPNVPLVPPPIAVLPA